MHYYSWLGQNSSTSVDVLLDEERLRSAIHKFKELRVSGLGLAWVDLNWVKSDRSGLHRMRLRSGIHEFKGAAGERAWRCAALLIRGCVYTQPQEGGPSSARWLRKSDPDAPLPSPLLPLQDAAAQAGLRLRISETNSAVNGGKRGLSEVFGAALWTADTTFEFAKAGASGIHMHWGNGGTPGGGGPAYVGVQTNFRMGNPDLPYPSVHAPW